MRLRAPRAVTLPPLASSVRGRTTARRGWSIWAYRSLIWNFTQRDLKARYKGTLLGWVWSLVVPLATLLIYTLVFSVIFRARAARTSATASRASSRSGSSAGSSPGPSWRSRSNWASRRCSATDPCSRRSTSRRTCRSWERWVPSSSRRSSRQAIYAVVLLLLGNVGHLVAALPSLAGHLPGLRGLDRRLRWPSSTSTTATSSTSPAWSCSCVFFLTPIIYPIDLVPVEWQRHPAPAAHPAQPRRPVRGGLPGAVLRARGSRACRLGWSLLAWAAVALVLASLVYRRWGLDVGEAV